MAAALGAALISPENPTWDVQIARLALMRPTLVKVQFTPGFATTPAHVTQLLDALPSVQSLILRGEDGDPTYERNRRELLPWLDVLRRPGLHTVIELGNEPDRVKQPPSIDWYRDEGLKTIRLLRDELREQQGIDGLDWSLSLPTNLPDVERLFAGGDYARDCTCIASHLYGFWCLLDADVPTEWERIWWWLLEHTTRPIWITEAGIDDEDTPLIEKARRYLSFLAGTPDRLRGLALWAPVSTAAAGFENYMLDDPALRALGARAGNGDLPMATPIFGPTRTTIASAEQWARARGAHPRFVAVLPLYYKHAPRYEQPAENAIGQSAKETNYGHFTGIVGPEQHNWCGLKTKDADSEDKEDHATFPDDEAGVIAHLQHLSGYGGKRADELPDALVDPRFHLISAHRNTIEGLGGAWAPSASYGIETAQIIASIPKTAPQPGPAPARRVKVALAAGHHNADAGGTGGEWERTGELTEEVARQLMLHGGFDVRVITPDGPDADNDPGDGTFPGGLQAAARRAVEWKAQGWAADIYLEVHFEGTSSPNTRGCFAIYADWGSDVDTVMRDQLGPALARAVSMATGLPRRGSGVMSEKNTGVGGQGFRLGVLLATATLGAPRTIFEFGALTSPADKAIIDAPGFNQKAGWAISTALAEHFDVVEEGEPMPPPAPSVIIQEGNPNGKLKIERGFAGFFWKLGWIINPADPLTGILAIAGWVEEEEEETDFGARIVMEKGSEWHWIRAAAGTPWEFQQAQRPELVFAGVDPLLVMQAMSRILETATTIIERTTGMAEQVHLITDLATELAEQAESAGAAAAD